MVAVRRSLSGHGDHGIHLPVFGVDHPDHGALLVIEKVKPWKLNKGHFSGVDVHHMNPTSFVSVIAESASNPPTVPIPSRRKFKVVGSHAQSDESLK